MVSIVVEKRWMPFPSLAAPSARTSSSHPELSMRRARSLRKESCKTWVWEHSLFHGYIKPYYWVDDHPLLYRNNGSLDPSTVDAFNSSEKYLSNWIISWNRDESRLKNISNHHQDEFGWWCISSDYNIRIVQGHPFGMDHLQYDANADGNSQGFLVGKCCHSLGGNLKRSPCSSPKTPRNWAEKTSLERSRKLEKPGDWFLDCFCKLLLSGSMLHYAVRFRSSILAQYSSSLNNGQARWVIIQDIIIIVLKDHFSNNLKNKPRAHM